MASVRLSVPRVFTSATPYLSASVLVMSWLPVVNTMKVTTPCSGVGSTNPDLARPPPVVTVVGKCLSCLRRCSPATPVPPARHRPQALRSTHRISSLRGQRRRRGAYRVCPPAGNNDVRVGVSHLLISSCPRADLLLSSSKRLLLGVSDSRRVCVLGAWHEAAMTVVKSRGSSWPQRST